MANEKTGYVYILTNPSFREDWVKIGKTTDMTTRLRTLDNTSVPLPFEVFATLKTAKYDKAETLIHHYIERFTNLRIRDKREFFNVKPEEALAIFKDVAAVLEDAEICEVYKEGYNPDCKKNALHKKEIDDTKKSTVWLLPYNKKYFDLESCYEKYGEVYWTMHCNLNPGDYGYIYGSSPESAIRFSFRVLDSYLEYQPIMNREHEFVLRQTNEEVAGQGKLFAHFRLTGKINSKRLTLANLLEHGLKSAPMGAIKLSNNKELKQYIEENF